jgi:hypothetical protein
MVIVEVGLFSESTICLGSDRFLFQLATGRAPFPGWPDHKVPILVLKGRRPTMPRPLDASEKTSLVWKIAEMCWHQDAKERPEVDVVLKHLENPADPDPGTCTLRVFPSGKGDD